MSKPCKSLAYVLGGAAHTGAHVLPINTIRPYASRLLTAGRDGAIVLYDNSGSIESHIQLHSDWANDALLFADPLVVSCSSDLSLKWWNFENDDHGLIGHHNDYVKALAKVGDRVISGGLDKCVNVWDVARKEKLQSYVNEYGEKGSIYSMAASASSSVLIFGDNVGNVQLFDVKAAQVVSTFSGHKDTVKSLLVSDTKCLSGSSDGTVRLWDLRNKQEPIKTYTHSDTAVWSLFSPETEDFEKNFYTGSANGTLYHTTQDITKTVGQEPKGILSIAEFQGELWSSTMNDSNMKNWTDESKSKKGDAALIKSRMLNNRRHVVTLSTDNTVVLWDILKCAPVKEFGSDCVFEDVVEELQTKEILPTWCSVTIRAGKLFVVLRESSFTNTEVYGNDLEEYGWNLDRDCRYNLGKILIRSIFQNLLDHELQRDQVFRDQRARELKGSSKLNLLTKFSSQDNSPVSTPIDEMKGYFSDTAAGSASTATTSTNPPPSSAPESSEQTVTTPTSGRRKLKFFSRKPSKVSATLSEADESDSELPRQMSNCSVDSPLGSKDSSRKSSHVGDPDSLAFLLSEIRTHYESVTSASQLMNNTQLTPPPADEVPVLIPPKDLHIIINERIAHSASEVDIFSEQLSHLHFPTLEQHLPKWIGLFLLKNKTLVKDFPKVGFVIKLHPDAEASLPGVTGGETRLNAYSMLRVRRVLSYITERLEYRPPEVVGGQDPEKWLEALCHDMVLDNNMTLATLRSVIWKQSGDVVITYRRKPRE